MSMLKLPKSIAWMIATMVTLLILMTVYRIIVHLFFAAAIAPAGIGELLWMGLRFDARYVSIITLPLFAIGLINGFHLYKSRTGKRFGIFYFTFFTTVFLLLYGLDFGNLIAYNEHANRNTFDELLRQQATEKKLFTTVPWVIILLLAGVGSWLLYLLLRFTHHAIGTAKSSDSKVMRLFWQSLLLLLMLGAMYGTIGPSMLSPKATKAFNSNDARKVAINVFENIFAGTAP